MSDFYTTDAARPVRDPDSLGVPDDAPGTFGCNRSPVRGPLVDVGTPTPMHEDVMPSLGSEFLFQMRVKLAPPLDVGPTPEGRRIIFMGRSGTVDGPRIKGQVMPMSGGDWSRIRADGSGALDVRLSLRTDDGAIIHMTYFGRMVAADADMAYALDFAKPDDPAGAHRYYFRTNPLFETGDDRYAWLNHLVAVGKGRTGDDGVIYDIFAVR